MSGLGTIDIEGKQLVFSANDLSKLTTPAGCELNLITDKVHKLDEDADGDADDNSSVGSEAAELHDDDLTMGPSNGPSTAQDRQAREIRRRREFLSLVLNANRDPVKPGTKCRFKEYQEEVYSAADGDLADFVCDTRNLDCSYVGIHKQYESMGNYEEYMRNNSFEEVSPGRVFKLSRVPGVQVPVTDEALVMYNCAFWTEGSREPFDSTWLRRTTITTHLARDSVLPGLQELLLTCSKGELCEAFIRPEAAFGKLGVRPRIPANATIFCLLEVVKVVSGDKFATIILGSANNNGTLMFADLYDASDEARRRGNHFYQQGEYRIALQRYKSAIRLLEGLTYRNEEEEARAQSLLIKLYNNCARTANAIGAPRLALAACKQARLINDRVPKTHWHRLTAWQKRGFTDRALGVARRAMQLFDNDPVSVREFRKVADNLVAKLNEERRQVEDLHRLMGRALLSSA